MPSSQSSNTSKLKAMMMTYAVCDAAVLLQSTSHCALFGHFTLCEREDLTSEKQLLLHRDLYGPYDEVCETKRSSAEEAKYSR